MLSRGTTLLVFAAGIAQPIIWVDKPMEIMGPTIFYMLFTAMVALLVLGLYFTTVDNE